MRAQRQEGIKWKGDYVIDSQVYTENLDLYLDISFGFVYYAAVVRKKTIFSSFYLEHIPFVYIMLLH